MTLAKAAPTDWAKWFAAVTGMPVEKVREKLGMGGQTPHQVYNKSGPGGAGNTIRDLTEHPCIRESRSAG